MKVKIYQPSKTAMQSGRAKTNHWILEAEPNSARKPEPLMGWISSKDTLNQIRINFKSCEDAVQFAKTKGWDIFVQKSQSRQIRPKSYADNFRRPL